VTQKQLNLLLHVTNVVLVRKDGLQDIGVVDYQDMHQLWDLKVKRVDTGKRPYENLEVTDEYIIRKFPHDTEAEDLLWHRDRENRLIEHVSGTKWSFQYDNELPIPIEPNHYIDIPAGAWHRIHRGSDDLIIKINFL